MGYFETRGGLSLDGGETYDETVPLNLLKGAFQGDGCEEATATAFVAKE